MKKKEKIVNYTVDKKKLTDQLLLNDSSNWLIAEGAKMVFDGKTPGKYMVAFLEKMEIIQAEA